MKAICPHCRYVFDHDAPEGQLYRCAQCGEFFHVGDDLGHFTTTKENVQGTVRPPDAKEAQEGETGSIVHALAEERELPLDTSGIPGSIEAQDRIRAPESRRNKRNAFRQMVYEYSRVPQAIRDFCAASDNGKDTSLCRKQVPIVVRIYGTVMMYLSVIGILASILGLYITVKEAWGPGPLLACIFSFAMCYVSMCIGKGLTKGQRSAVYAMYVLALLHGVPLAVALSISAGWTLSDFLVLGLWALWYLPPIFSAFGHWEAFSKGRSIG
jgi:hypothetical protein